MYYLVNPYICVMSSNSRITQSKGEPEAVSLPSRTRRCKKSTTMDDQLLRPTSSQSTASPTPPAEDAHAEARCQSTPPLPPGSTSQDAGDPSASLTTSTSKTTDTPCPFTKVARLWITLITNVCSSLHRRKVQHQL